jgi:putative flippase GtrA
VPRPGADSLRGLVSEGTRYLSASAAALAIDFGLYLGLIRYAEMNYLVAAPIAFLLGLATIYVLSVHWVFINRRLADARMEFMIFASIGIAGLLLNQAVLYAAVEIFSQSYETAKLVSAGIVFCFNFVLRKLFLFTRYQG